MLEHMGRDIRSGRPVGEDPGEGVTEEAHSAAALSAVYICGWRNGLLAVPGRQGPARARQDHVVDSGEEEDADDAHDRLGGERPLEGIQEERAELIDPGHHADARDADRAHRDHADAGQQHGNRERQLDDEESLPAREPDRRRRGDARPSDTEANASAAERTMIATA